MSKNGLLLKENPARNAALLAALLPITFLSDFKLIKDGIHCYFKFKISSINSEIEFFLTVMNEISDDQFYFEQVSDNEAILKVFSLVL